MFKLPKLLIDKISDYEYYLNKYLAKEMPGDRFKPIRVPLGFYSQRMSEKLMARIRIPGGYLSAGQLKAISYIAKKLNVNIHLTTRQDIQLHTVEPGDSIQILNYLKDYNLSPFGGGGNTVRNILCCPLSGICPDEKIIVKKYAIAVSELLLSGPLALGQLPRKFKISFSGCSNSCALSKFNDIGLYPAEKDNKKGFKIYIGGGLGAVSAIGSLFENFVSTTELPYVIKALMLTFNKYGERKNRHKNRLRFLIKKIGLGQFRQYYLKILKDLKQTEYLSLRNIEFNNSLPDLSAEKIDSLSHSDKDFLLFLKTNVIKQKQKNYYAVELKINQGDINADDLEKLADLKNDIPTIAFKTTLSQNIMILNIPYTKLIFIYDYLVKIFPDKNFLFPNTILDTICCKGASTCNLGICNSPSLSKAIEAKLKKSNIDPENFKNFKFKISGCPNNCAQHITADLGLQGMVRKVNLKPAPFYKFFINAHRTEENTSFAKEIGVAPVKNIPAILSEFLQNVKTPFSIENKDSFWTDDTIDLLSSLIEKYSFVPEYEEDKSFYRDIGEDKDFSLSGIGPGECGAGVVDLIENDIKESEKIIKNDINSSSIDMLKKSLMLSARALLVIKGIEPKNAEEVFSNFKKYFIDTKISKPEFADLSDVYSNLTGPEKLYNYASNFLKHIKHLYSIMDPNFKFPAEAENKQAAKEIKTLDLKGVLCPLNYVKAKIYLENLEKETIVEIILDDGESITNVPESLKKDGQEILNIEKINDYYKVTVKKKN